VLSPELSWIEKRKVYNLMWGGQGTWFVFTKRTIGNPPMNANEPFEMVKKSEERAVGIPVVRTDAAENSRKLQDKATRTWAGDPKKMK